MTLCLALSIVAAARRQQESWPTVGMARARGGAMAEVAARDQVVAMVHGEGMAAAACWVVAL